MIRIHVMVCKTVAVDENLNNVLPLASAVGIGLVHQSISVQTKKLLQLFYYCGQHDHHAAEKKKNVTQAPVSYI